MTAKTFKTLSLIGIALPLFIVPNDSRAHESDTPHRHTTRAEIEKREKQRIERLTGGVIKAENNQSQGFIPAPAGHTDDHEHDDEGFDLDENGERDFTNGRHEKPKERRARLKEEAKALRENRRENQARKVEEARQYREAVRERRDNRP